MNYATLALRSQNDNVGKRPNPPFFVAHIRVVPKIKSEEK